MRSASPRLYGGLSGAAGREHDALFRGERAPLAVDLRHDPGDPPVLRRELERTGVRAQVRPALRDRLEHRCDERAATRHDAFGDALPRELHPSALVAALLELLHLLLRDRLHARRVARLPRATRARLPVGLPHARAQLTEPVELVQIRGDEPSEIEGAREVGAALVVGPLEVDVEGERGVRLDEVDDLRCGVDEPVDDALVGDALGEMHEVALHLFARVLDAGLLGHVRARQPHATARDRRGAAELVRDLEQRHLRAADARPQRGHHPGAARTDHDHIGRPLAHRSSSPDRLTRTG